MIFKKEFRYDCEKFISTLSYRESRSLTNRLASKCFVTIRKDDFRPMVAVAHIWSDGKRMISGGGISAREQCCSMRRRAPSSFSRSRDREIAIERCLCIGDLSRHVLDEVTIKCQIERDAQKLLGFRLLLKF